MTARHGLVIGKFYPPHAGHHRLIDVAAAGSERVTVLVCDQMVESIPGRLRTVWVDEAHRHQPHVSVVHAADPNPVDFDDPAVWDRHVDAFMAALGQSEHREEPVDAVFSSEPYGEELARRFGAAAVCVDLARTEVAASGTAVRADPVAHWDLIDAPVRGWFARRVTLVGGDARATAELARALADRLRRRGGPWALTRSVTSTASTGGADQVDSAAVVADHIQRENQSARLGGPVLVCASGRLMAASPEWHLTSIARGDVEGITAHRSYLLLAGEGVDSGPGGIGEEACRWAAVLEQAGVDWRWLQGSPAQQAGAAERAVDEIIERGWSLAAPLG